MDEKGLNGSGVLRLWNKIKATFATKTEVEKSISECEKPFVVTATADFVSNVLTGLSHTFTQISEAYNRGDHVYLDIDISQALPGHHVLLNLTIFLPGQYMYFDLMCTLDTSTHISAQIIADGSSAFSYIPLTRGGFTVIVSDTEPTADDRSVFTCVIEG
jgi:hypothetical protein